MEQQDDTSSEQEQILALYVYVLERVGKITERCTATKSNRQAIACATYLGAILNDAQAVFFLLLYKLPFSVPKLLRSILESVVSVKAISKDISYIDYLVFESAYKKKKHVIRMKNLSKSQEYSYRFFIEDESVEFLDSIIAKYAGEWKKPYTIEKKFQLADLQYMYDISYASLSESVHSALTNLTSSFQRREESGPLVSQNNSVDNLTIASWVEIATLSMIDSVECLCAVCPADPGRELLEAKWQLIQFQRKYFPDHCPEHYKEYPE